MTLVPDFSVQRVFVDPWTTGIDSHGMMALVTFLVGCTCGLVGNFLILRRMALMGDAISHSVLPGIAVAFLVTGSRGIGAMVLGAFVAAFATHLLVEAITRHSRVRPDAAIGIAFSTLFALGVVLVAVFADRVDLDQDCVLNGELPMIPLEPPVHLGSLSLGPPPLVRLAGLLVGSVLMLALFYKELLLTSFDPGLAAALGLPVRAVHHGLMLWLALAVVASFEAVGAILVIALLILPGATAALLTERMVPRLVLGVVHAALSAIGGMHLSVALDCSPAGASVVAGGAWFTLAWLFSPTSGWVPRWWRSRGGCLNRRPVADEGPGGEPDGGFDQGPGPGRR